MLHCAHTTQLLELIAMSHLLIKEQVSIYTLPAFDTQHPAAPGTQISIGDLHGNTMKLIFLLVKHGIAKNLSQSDYNQLVSIYRKQTHELTKADLSAFNALLDKIEFNTNTKVRLIGDELADRGKNDYFTLKIIEKLHNKKVPLEILISNHGVEFVEASEIQNNFHAPMLQNGHASSMVALQQIIENGLVSQTEVVDLANRVYKPHLKALSYSLNEDKTGITLYSHAPIGINTIEKLAKDLGLNYTDGSAIQLAQTIDAINELFQAYVDAGAVHYLYSREQMENGYSGYVEPHAAFEMLMWNRHYHEGQIKRPDMIGNYTVNYVHGHDSTPQTQHNIYNLDNILGKSDNLNQGEYTVLYSHETQLTNQRQLTLENSIKKAQIEPVLKRIDRVLADLTNKIGQIKQHPNTKAHKVATELLEQLQKNKQNHEKHLLLGMKTEHAQKIFAIACTKAINQAKPVLESDLNWGDYLVNLAKRMINAVIAAVTLNHYPEFFKPVQSKSLNAVEQLQNDLGLRQAMLI